MNWEFFRERGCFLGHVVWNDACNGQFKYARCWYFMPKYHDVTICEQLPFGCQIVWNYFAISLGKGEVDGARMLLQKEVHKEQIKPNVKQF